MCLDELEKWLSANKVKLNGDKLNSSFCAQIGNKEKRLRGYLTSQSTITAANVLVGS